MEMLRFGTSLVASLFLLAFAPTVPYVSAPDPFSNLGDSATAPGWNQTIANGVVIKAPQIYATDFTHIAIIIIAGEGNIGTMNTDKFTTTNNHIGHIYNWSVYDGGIYYNDNNSKVSDPWIGASAECTGNPEGCGTGGWTGYLAEAILDNCVWYTDVYIMPLAIYQSTIADWDTGVLSNRLPIAVKRVASRLTVGDIYILWGQGESDHGTSQVDYQNALSSIITKAKQAATDVGNIGTVWTFVAQQTYNAGVTDTNVRNAQAAVVDCNEHGAAICAGPDADALNSTFRQSGNTYWNGFGVTNGASAYANLWLTALQQIDPFACTDAVTCH